MIFCRFSEIWKSSSKSKLIFPMLSNFLDNPFWKSHQLFEKLSITCVNPIGSQRIYREDFYVMGNITSAGVFQLTSSSKVFTFNSGTSSTIALTPNGSSLDVVITGGGGYGDSNCHARVDFELIDATQRRLF